MANRSFQIFLSEYIIITRKTMEGNMDKSDLQVLTGNNLQRCRTRAKLTQEQVAEKAGISTSFYTNLERGSRSMSIPVLLALADVLQVSTDCILYEESSRIHIANICNLLNDKPESFIIAAEGVLCALVKGFSPCQEESLE